VTAEPARTLRLAAAPSWSPSSSAAPLALVPDPPGAPAQQPLPLQWTSYARPPVAVPPERPDPGDEGLPPDLEQWVARLSAAVLEVLHGARPAGQLSRWLAPRVHRALADRAARVRPLQAGPPRVAVRSVHVTPRLPAHPDDSPAVEAAAVVAVGPRCRAVALRLEPHAGRWRVTALEVG